MKTRASFRIVLGTVAVAALLCGCSGGKKKSPGPGGWAASVGDEGTLVETFGEDPWTARQIADVDLLAVSCVNNRVGWAVGRDGRLVHTVDGGASWALQRSGVDSDLRALAMAITGDGRYAGIAVGDRGAFLRTIDGMNWSPVDTSLIETMRGAATSVKATLLLASGDTGTLLRSEDFGASWLGVGVGSANVTDVALDASGNIALAVDDAGGVWESRDRALHFERIYIADRSLESVSLGRSGDYAVASGVRGLTLVRDHDGPFEIVDSGTDVDLHAALVGPTESEFYLAGDHGMLAESRDFGRTWELEDSGTAVALRSLEDLEAR